MQTPDAVLRLLKELERSLRSMLDLRSFPKARIEAARAQGERAKELQRGEIPASYFRNAIYELNRLRNEAAGTKGMALRYTPHSLDGPAMEEEFFRQALAYEARVLEVHYSGYSSFPKTARRNAEDLVAEIRQVALSQEPLIDSGSLSL